MSGTGPDRLRAAARSSRILAAEIQQNQCVCGILSAPLREDKTLKEFKGLYFQTLARGVDVSDIDGLMTIAFAAYNERHNRSELYANLHAMEDMMRSFSDPPRKENQFLYVAIGASDSMGAGANPGSKGWVYLVAKRLRARCPGALVRSFAEGGKTTEHAREVQLPQVIEAQPDLVTYAAGLNDLQYGLPLDKAKANTEVVLKEIKAHTKAFVVMTTLSVAKCAPLFSSDIPKLRDRLKNLSPERIGAFNQAYEELADRYGAVLVDIGRMVTDSMSPDDVDALFSYDGMHPNNEGHSRIADIFWAGIEKALTKRDSPLTQ